MTDLEKLRREAHEALVEAILAERSYQNGADKVIAVTAHEKAIAAIDALAEGGHAPHCCCHEEGEDSPGAKGISDECYQAFYNGDFKKHSHPYLDPRCSPSPLSAGAREKVREALDLLRRAAWRGTFTDEAITLLESALAEQQLARIQVESIFICLGMLLTGSLGWSSDSSKEFQDALRALIAEQEGE